MWKIVEAAPLWGRHAGNEVLVDLVDDAAGADRTLTLTEVSRRYSLPLGTIHRHRSKCIGAPSSTQIAAASTKLAVLQATLPTRDELGSMYGGLRDQLAAIVDDAHAKGQLLVSVNPIDAVRKNLDSTANTRRL